MRHSGDIPVWGQHIIPPGNPEDDELAMALADVGEPREHPVPEEAIAALPLTRATEPSECCVCQDGIHLGDEATQLPCGHAYHPDCIVEWLRRQHTCPVCRADAVPQLREEDEDENHIGIGVEDLGDDGSQDEERTRLDALFPGLRELDALRHDVIAEQQAIEAAEDEGMQHNEDTRSNEDMQNNEDDEDGDAQAMASRSQAGRLITARFDRMLAAIEEGNAAMSIVQTPPESPLGGVGENTHGEDHVVETEAMERDAGEDVNVEDGDESEETAARLRQCLAVWKESMPAEAPQPCTAEDVTREVRELRRENRRLHEESARLRARLLAVERRLHGDDDPVTGNPGKAKVHARHDTSALLPATLGILSQLQVDVLSRAKAEANSILADPLCL